MGFMINSILISIIALSGVFLRYIPFHTIVSTKQKKQLLLSYSAFFILQFIILHFFFSCLPLTPKAYKFILLCDGLCCFTINCTLIPNQFFKHIFIYAIQGTYFLFLHSFVALLIGRFFLYLPVTQQFYIQNLGFLILFVMSSYPVWKILKTSFIPRIAQEQNYYWKWIWLVPAFTLIGNMIITMDGEWISSWKQFFARILMAATVIASWKCISLDFEELEEKIRVKNENELLSLQIKSISDNAHLIEEKEEKIKILRHDMRHQIQMLFSFISENENEKALAMIHKFNSELTPIRIATFCQNQIINSAISIYADKAISFQTELEYEIFLPKELPFDENDLAILFANVLDNAVNASLSQVEENRIIKIKSRYEQNQLVIFIENYFDGIIPFNNNGVPISQKEGHGFGMKSVLSVVKKYNGTAVFTHENNIFAAGFIFFKS